MKEPNALISEPSVIERPTERQQANLSKIQRNALTCLYQHRLLSTGQLKRLLVPTTDHKANYLRRQLRELRRRGLVGSVASGERSHQSLWFATTQGAEQVELGREVDARGYRMTAEIADGPLQLHTLAVNEVGIAFVETARTHGHECSPLDWVHEVAHRMRDGSGRRVDHEYLITDAVLHYVFVGSDGRRIQTRAFLELDRCTMTVARLAAKIASYARYHQYVPGGDAPGKQPVGSLPAWRYRYPRFPSVVVVLTGAGSAAMRTRINDLRVLCAEDPWLRRCGHELAIGATTLERLRDQGPLEKIFVPVLGTDDSPTDLSMRP